GASFSSRPTCGLPANPASRCSLAPSDPSAASCHKVAGTNGTVLDRIGGGGQADHLLHHDRGAVEGSSLGVEDDNLSLESRSRFTGVKPHRDPLREKKTVDTDRTWRWFRRSRSGRRLS